MEAAVLRSHDQLYTIHFTYLELASVWVYIFKVIVNCCLKLFAYVM